MFWRQPTSKRTTCVAPPGGAAKVGEVHPAGRELLADKLRALVGSQLAKWMVARERVVYDYVVGLLGAAQVVPAIIVYQRNAVFPVLLDEIVEKEALTGNHRDAWVYLDSINVEF